MMKFEFSMDKVYISKGFFLVSNIKIIYKHAPRQTFSSADNV